MPNADEHGRDSDWRRWVPDAVRKYIPGSDDTSAASVEDWTQFVPAEWRHWLSASPAPRPQTRTLRFIGVDEERPGPAWEALYRETWGAYRSWWLQKGGDQRPDRGEAEAALRQHMPELVGVHEHLVRLAGDDDTTTAMLALWNPPPFIVACSQTVVPDRETGEPVLLRNYDYDPHLFEATVYRSRWSSRRVLGTGDCLWGLVDGVNDDGLAVSLTFGGRQNIGEGFGIPLVIRYLLEVAGDVPEGIEVLRRLPHQLSYNVTLCDRSGRVATVFIAPDRPARVTEQRATTNHPETVEWPQHAAWVRSVERLDTLRQLAADGVDADSMTAAMLAPPLLARKWDEGFATLFTAVYRPMSGRLDYHWPGQHVSLAVDRPVPAAFEVHLDE
ncbi:MAG: C45 family autoproteolytic acyltransferase/hydrolase [Gaiellales bacterium]